ncbi:Glyoxylase, beta-lactamase superfamily II [Agreia bicolorata]|uniref:Glyoxylase, beta-lactamase superfamily II n=1 Tax=Agreia bicolorata TaxID=110935 RepID=A0A1T4XN22_9MICO|nr:N-acyl homoserine lactonase family protein [Agreia bicolorata]SKA90511.1 Glyoxylase, beta-lactamase superfamily II [Agreia bicolorata]
MNTAVVKDDEYEVAIARHGTRVGMRSEAFLNYSLSGEPDSVIVTDYFLWVIRNETRTIFVDTGFSAAAAQRRGRTVISSPADIYRSLGVEPGAGWPLIVTHAHWDHIGNLDLFPTSPIWMARSEVEFWETSISRAPQIAHFTEASELAELSHLRQSRRLRLFEGSTEIAPGVRVLEVGGHTPGQSMVTVATSVGTVLLTSDVAHFREELRDELPFVALTDLPDSIAGYRRVKELLASGAVDIVVTGHDQAELELGERVNSNLTIIGRRNL